MPASKQSLRNAAKKSNKSSEISEPTAKATLDFREQLLKLATSSVLYQVGLKMPAILKQFPEIINQLKEGKAAEKLEPPKSEAPPKEADAADENTPKEEVQTEGSAETAEKSVDNGCSKDDAGSLFELLISRLTLTNPLGLFETGDDAVKCFNEMKGLEFDGGPKTRRKGSPVIDRMLANLQGHLLVYFHVIWALMMLRSLLFRSFFACLPWLFLYQMLSVMLPLQKSEKIPLPLEKAPVEFRLTGTMLLHALVWFFFVYEFVFRVWWLEWFFAIAVIGSHAYVFRPVDA